MSDLTPVTTSPYRLVDPSPWPIVGAIAALLLTGGMVMYMHKIWGFGGEVVLAAGVISRTMSSGGATS